MSASQSPRRLLRLSSLVPLLALSSSVSATRFISLSSFQHITSPQIPVQCIIAYNSMILGCVLDDFVDGNFCSSQCVAGLGMTEETVQVACDGVAVDPRTVMGMALQGMLVELLCPERGNDEEDEEEEEDDKEEEFTSTRRTSTKTDQATSTTRPLFSFTSPASSSQTQFTTSTPLGNFPDFTSLTTVQPNIPPTSQAGQDESRPTLQPENGGGSPFEEPFSGTGRTGVSLMAALAAGVAGMAVLF